MTEPLKSPAVSVEELTKTGIDADVRTPTEPGNVNVKLSPWLSDKGLTSVAVTQTSALDACPDSKITGLTLKFNGELAVWEKERGARAAISNTAHKPALARFAFIILLLHSEIFYFGRLKVHAHNGASCPPADVTRFCFRSSFRRRPAGYSLRFGRGRTNFVNL